ncbi:LysR family transcriptional regulator [Conexibacter sp. DBS9H8]|uniref:LysR family transcriptional regulator n=1 Tax=Conexibacter sp. DBS9H8 TaxID=2937801 RepID=UPI00200E8D68|nr:LysR family transcriptional regulator [Conexibacter sp. DBS9H8]
MISLTRLRVLQEVVRRGSFSGAADALQYTQSAVSQAVARLEAELGTALVVRDRRGARATPAGETLLAHAEAIFAQVEAAEADLHAMLGLRGGRLRIAVFPSAGSTLMPEAIAAFRRRHPEVQLFLVEGEPETVVPRLRAGEVDLALLFAFPGADDPVAGALAHGGGLEVTPLLEDVMHVTLPSEHPLAGAAEVTLWDLRDEDWVQTAEPSPCARHVVRLCRTAGFEPRVTFESDDYETIQGLVAAGVGVALIPHLALTRVHHGVSVRSLAPTRPSRSVVAATAGGAGVAPSAAAMLEILTVIAPDYADVRGWG